MTISLILTPISGERRETIRFPERLRLHDPNAGGPVSRSLVKELYLMPQH